MEGVGIGTASIILTGRVWRNLRQIDPKHSNNQAKYKVLIWGLQILLQKKVKCAQIYGDSQLVIQHMKGKYKCNAITLAEFYNSAK